MSILQSCLTREEWYDRIYRKSKSDRALRVGKAALKAFDEFCNKKYHNNSDEMIKKIRSQEGDQIYILLNHYVSFLDDKSPKTVRTYFSYVRSYLRTQGIKVDSDYVKDFVSLPTLLRIRRKPLTEEIIQKLLDNSKEKRKTLYLTLLSSGMRIGEALCLRKRDFDFSKEPTLISIPAKYTKTREARETFISSEARELILRLVKRKNPDDLVFTKQASNEQAVHNEEAAFGKLRRRCDLIEKYDDEKRFVINIHAFRAYFHTKASMVHGTEYANALDGHSSYLGQYYRQTLEERSRLYQELEPQLLIYGNKIIARNQKELHESLSKKSEEIELLKYRDSIKDDAITNLADHVNRLENEIEGLRDKISNKNLKQ